MTTIELKPLAETSDPNATGTLSLGIAADGDFRWAAVDLTVPVERLRRRLDLSPLAAVAIGRTMAAAALLFRFLTKDPGRLRLEIKGDGPLGDLMAEVDEDGRIRGMAGGDLQFPGFGDGGLDVGRAVGKGTLQGHPGGGRRPPLRRPGGAHRAARSASDLVHYLEQSQQIHSAALLGVLPVPSGIGAAGGLLIEAMPGVSDQRLLQLEDNLAQLQGISHYLRQGGAEALRQGRAGRPRAARARGPHGPYGCGCLRAELLPRLLTLPSEDLQTLWADTGTCEVVCGFCNGSFHFTADELRLASISRAPPRAAAPARPRPALPPAAAQRGTHAERAKRPRTRRPAYLRDDADLLRQRLSAHRPHLHHPGGRHHGALAPAAPANGSIS